jgi:hypothetical protein
MRTIQRLMLIGLTASLLFSLPVLGQGKVPQPTNGTVSFYVPSVTTGEVRTSLTVTKPSDPPPAPPRKPLVNGNPGAGEVDGNHNFPAGTTSGGIGAYYKGLLSNNGWKEGTDFTVDGGVINFYGITKLDGGVNKGGVKCGGATDSKDVPFGAISANNIKVVKMIRDGRRMDGSLTLVGFGVRFKPDQTFTTSTSTVTAYFTARDSAAGAIAKIRDALVKAGWQAAINTEGDLEITSNAAGAPVSSLYHQIEYYSDDATEENDDHWVFTVVAPATDTDSVPVGEPH